MRIISDFHDYYDCIQSSGQDLETIYFRKRKKVALNELPFPAFRCKYSQSKVFFREIIVGFCGKIYPVLKINCRHYGEEDTEYFCYNVNEVDEVVRTNCKKKEIAAYLVRGSKKYWCEHSKYWYNEHRRTFIEQFFNKCAEEQDAYNELFITSKSPIFVARYYSKIYPKCQHSIIYNDSLQKIQFVRLFDPYMAFQEIYSYISNIAQPLKPIPDISDRDMLEAKGFDKKWSFRKEPTKKN